MVCIIYGLLAKCEPSFRAGSAVALIYANVLIRKDEKWFVEEDPGTGERWYWPVQYTDLDCHYERVEQILAAQEYPFHLAPYNETPKTNEFKAAAEQRGLDWSLPNLAVTFANKGKSRYPVSRSTRPRIAGTSTN